MGLALENRVLIALNSLMQYRAFGWGAIHNNFIKSHGNTKHHVVNSSTNQKVAFEARVRRVSHNSRAFHVLKRVFKDPQGDIFITTALWTTEWEDVSKKWKLEWIKHHRIAVPSKTVAAEMKGVSQRRRMMNHNEYFLDEYDYYNFDPVATVVSHSRKGRSKKEASLNTNRPNPAGHERKVLTKLQNTERKRKESNLRASTKVKN